MARRLVTTMTALVVALYGLLLVPTAARADGDFPVVSNGTVSPSQLPYAGGFVTVDADVTADYPVFNLVWIKVTDPSGHVQDESAMSNNSGGSTFEGTIELGANYTSDPVTYQLSVRARDLNNQETEAPAGSVTVAGVPPNTPPTVSGALVSAHKFTSAGGVVSFAVSATDPDGLSEVYATIKHGGTTTKVPFVVGSSDRFAGTWRVPRNATAAAARYAVTLTAADASGLPTSVSGGSITVARPVARLTLSTAVLRFGTTTRGSKVLRCVVVRNIGPEVSAPVTVAIATSAVAFSVLGPSRFPLTPGSTRTVSIQFLPRFAGDRRGALHLTRGDGRSGLTAVLIGHSAR